MNSNPPASPTHRPAPDLVLHKFHASDATEFGFYHWKADGEERARVVVLHGMGSACTEFAPQGEFLSRRGISVLAPNLRSNGHDPDPFRRGHCLDLPILRADFEAFCHATQLTQGGTPVFLFGESMGSLLAVNFLRHGVPLPSLGGAILSSPVVDLARPTPRWLREIISLLAKLFPRLVIPPALFVHGKSDPLPLTRVKEYQDFIQTAPHRVEAFTINFTAGVGRLMDLAREAAPDLLVPVLVLAAGKDVFIRPEQTREWFDLIGSPDREFVVFPEAYHLLFHDTDASEVLEKVHAWISSHLSTSHPPAPNQPSTPPTTHATAH